MKYQDINKYLIQWTTSIFKDMSIGETKAGHHVITNHVKVGDFNDEELETFCQNKRDLKVIFLYNVQFDYKSD